MVIKNSPKIVKLIKERDEPRDEYFVPFYEAHQGGILSSDGSKIYFFGIIDIMTKFGAKKRMEYAFKSISQGPNVSCIPPKKYGERFMNFINEILN